MLQTDASERAMGQGRGLRTALGEGIGCLIGSRRQ
jgi:hypothetical protein